MWLNKKKLNKNQYSDPKARQPVHGIKSVNHQSAPEMTVEIDPIQLIEGRFNATDAADVLISLLNDKIRYHTIKSVNSTVTQAERNRSTHRIDQLKKSKRNILDLVVSASKMDQKIEIDSAVHIKLINKTSEQTEERKQDYGSTPLGG
jgi:hypothetical protein